MNPKVSVIVPNYNHARYLNQRIDSILNQTYQDFELILLDDCSTDNSREVLMSYKDNPHVSHIVFNEQNAGTAFRQWNKGVELAQGQYIWIAESDDWAKNDFLQTLMDILEKNPTLGLAYTHTYFMRNGRAIWQTKEEEGTIVHKGEDFIKLKLAYGNCIENVSMSVFKKSLFKNVNSKTYEWMKLCGDWMFYTQLARQTNVLEVLSKHSFYRQHISNISNSTEHNGATFLEGCDVMEYINTFVKINKFSFALFWGRKLYFYKNKFKYSKEIMKHIKKRIIKYSKLMWLCYLLISVNHEFKAIFVKG